jgi:hypothetical protein
MKIISHRGYWHSSAEKNSATAFERSFALGYGTETDVRDCCGHLCISHDMALGTEMRLDAFLATASTTAASAPLTLALNIKADGLAAALTRQLLVHPALDCFVFDMAVPDMRSYLQAGMPVFTRMSEVERVPAWLEHSAGVWLDSFGPEWYGAADIVALLDQGKRVCVVSPELHGRPHLALWQLLAPLSQRNGLILCTDVPEEASRYFQYSGAKP